MTGSQSVIYEFGPYRLDISQYQLLRDGQPIPVRPKVLDLLAILVEHSGRVLLREDLIRHLWPDSIVEEGNLAVCATEIRRLLGNDYIHTVPRRGYRFVVPVRRISTQDAPADSPVVASTSEVNTISSKELIEQQHYKLRENVPVIYYRPNSDVTFVERLTYVFAVAFASVGLFTLVWAMREREPIFGILGTVISSLAFPAIMFARHTRRERALPEMIDVIQKPQGSNLENPVKTEDTKGIRSQPVPGHTVQ